MSVRDELVCYLLRRVDVLVGERTDVAGVAEHLEGHAHALEALAEVVRGLADDDDRLRALSTLTLRDGYFAPGAGLDHSLSQFMGTSGEACDAFLTQLVRVARDDALARARAAGHLPYVRPS